VDEGPRAEGTRMKAPRKSAVLTTIKHY